MQPRLAKIRQRGEEMVKEADLVLDFDEIVRTGSMTREEVDIAKRYGMYKSRQAGEHMARVVVPGGRLTSAEVRALARLSATFSSNLVSFTTRQAAQLHRLRLSDLPVLTRELAAEGMTTFHSCGDVARNVAACPWASVCPHRRLDVLPYAEEAAQLLSASRDLDNLPRKYKVTFSGCTGGCGQAYINCLGVMGVVRKGADGVEETGFKVMIGGGLGRKPLCAQELYSFVPTDRIVALCRAIGILFRDEGDRSLRRAARLKFVVQNQGIEKCRELLDAIYEAEGLDSSGFETGPVEDCGPPIPERPLCEPEPRGTDGLCIQRIMAPKGELTSEALLRIAELSEMYADKYVYSTNRQNLELHGIAPEHLEALRKEIATLSLATTGFFGLQDIVTCVGTKHCPMAVTYAHNVTDLLEGVVRQEKYTSIRDKVLINISGCSNACSHYPIADIGLQGMRIRGQEGAVESYRVAVGGSEQNFGQPVGDFKEADCPRVVEALLDTFLKESESGDGTESLAAHVQRVGTAPYQQAVDALGIRYETNLGLRLLRL